MSSDKKPITTMFIYKITNTINGKVYIGQTIREATTRFRQHRKELRTNKHPNSYLQNAWNKYGESAFVFEVVEQFEPEMNFDLGNLERYWIKHYGSLDRNKGYNLTSGGKGTPSHIVTQETRKVLSEKCSGWNHSPEAKEKIRLSSTGRITRDKQVIDLSVGYVWESAKEAAEVYKINYPTLVGWLNGKNPNKTSLQYVEST
jgi:group I intron endonuclease